MLKYLLMVTCWNTYWWSHVGILTDGNMLEYLLMVTCWNTYWWSHVGILTDGNMLKYLLMVTCWNTYWWSHVEILTGGHMLKYLLMVTCWNTYWWSQVESINFTVLHIKLQAEKYFDSNVCDIYKFPKLITILVFKRRSVEWVAISKLTTAYKWKLQDQLNGIESGPTLDETTISSMTTGRPIWTGYEWTCLPGDSMDHGVTQNSKEENKKKTWSRCQFHRKLRHKIILKLMLTDDKIFK